MSGRIGALALAGALACGVADPEPLPRVVGASPSGEGVPPGAAAEVRFSAPVDAGGLLDGRRLALGEAGALRRDRPRGRERGRRGRPRRHHARLPGGRGAPRRAPPRGTAPRAHGVRARAVLARARRRRPARARPGRAAPDLRRGVRDGRGGRPATARRAHGGPRGRGDPRGGRRVRRGGEPRRAGASTSAATASGSGRRPAPSPGARSPRRRAGASFRPAASRWWRAAPGTVATPPGGDRGRSPAGRPRCSEGSRTIGRRRSRWRISGTVVATLGAAGGLICPIALEVIEPGAPDAPHNLACTAGSPGTF